MEKEEVAKSYAELKNYITRRKSTYTKLDRHDKAIDTILMDLIEAYKEKAEYWELTKKLMDERDKLFKEAIKYEKLVRKIEAKVEELKGKCDFMPDRVYHQIEVLKELLGE